MISVLIPLSGELPYFSETLKSLQHSSPEVNFEVIAVANGMSDSEFRHCERLIKTFDRAELQFFRLPEPSISKALNFGLSKAKYDLIARLDSDDLVHPKRLLIQYEFLSQNPDVSMVASYVGLIDEQGVNVGYVCGPLKNHEIRQVFKVRNCINHPSVMYRKSVVQILGGYQSDDEPAEDFGLWLKFKNGSKIEILPEVLTYYRLHPTQISFQKQKMQLHKSMCLIELAGNELKMTKNEMQLSKAINSHQVERSISSRMRIVKFSLKSPLLASRVLVNRIVFKFKASMLMYRDLEL